MGMSRKRKSWKSTFVRLSNQRLAATSSKLSCIEKLTACILEEFWKLAICKTFLVWLQQNIGMISLVRF